MSNKSSRPRWSHLYLVFLLTCLLLWLEHQAPLPAPWHELMLLVVVWLVFGLLGLWCQSNARALEDDVARVDAPARDAGQNVRQNVVAEPVKVAKPIPLLSQRQPNDYGLNPVVVVIARGGASSASSFTERNG